MSSPGTVCLSCNRPQPPECPPQSTSSSGARTPSCSFPGSKKFETYRSPKEMIGVKLSLPQERHKAMVRTELSDMRHHYKRVPSSRSTYRKRFCQSALNL